MVQTKIVRQSLLAKGQSVAFSSERADSPSCRYSQPKVSVKSHKIWVELDSLDSEDTISKKDMFKNWLD